MRQDGNKIAINPLATTDVTPPPTVDLKHEPKVISNEDLKRYAVATGQAVVRLKELSKRAALGAFMRKIGTARMGQAMLLDGEDHIKTILKECDDVMVQHGEDPDAVSVVLKTKLGLVELLVRMAEAQIETGKKSGTEESDAEPQNKPPPPLVAVQNNHYHNGVPNEKPMPYVGAESKTKA